MATGLFTVTRSIEVDKDAARVWAVFADFENWAEWTKFGVGSLSTRQHLSWIGGSAGPGGRVTVHWHGLRISECAAQVWNPPHQLFVATIIPKGQPDYFDVGLTMTPLADARTRVDFTTSMMIPSLGPFDYLIPVRWLVEAKIDAIIRRAVEML